MNIETAMIIALFINVGALIFVGYQTFLTRQSVKLTEKNIQEAQRVRELSDLPKASLVIYAQYKIKKFREDLQQLLSDEQLIRNQIEKNDTSLSSKYGLQKPTRLIDKIYYNMSPTWLQVILISAAQYYYHCKSLASFLPPKEKTEFALRFLPEIIDNAKEGVYRMTQLLSYIEKMVPEWYLECPASLNDSDFMDE